ncbi:hypothetical protein FNF29_05514 [Cafeteria roenbergensis]|uniref:Fibronectin type-III domain-containing protein n=2 Tax=Cafeteria roenbergensis TaxID=33653 RepID=A0A5A8CC12_CAFRO|nr:hypothetical protein FNF29_05514 [Cafeteria roenbergensis]|eukprot:KAA0150074.1 hypothetical protein FNF29_05514 [Cafeteria roenbergensis]
MRLAASAVRAWLTAPLVLCIFVGMAAPALAVCAPGVEDAPADIERLVVNATWFSNDNLVLGISAAAIGDLDDNGAVDFLAGLPQIDLGDNAKGTVAVFYMKPHMQGLTGEYYILLPGKNSALDARMTATGLFGVAVATGLPDASLGVSTFAVGAPGLVVTGEARAKGAVFLLEANPRTGDVPSYTEISASTAAAILPAAAQVDGAQFGRGLAVLGVESSGFAWLAVGVMHAQFNGVPYVGGVVLMKLNATNSLVSAVMLEPAGTSDAVLSMFTHGRQLGFSVAAVRDMSAPLDPSGVITLAVGTISDLALGPGTGGAVYVVRANMTGAVLDALRIDNTTHPVLSARVTPTGAFGYAIADAGDVNGDDTRDLLVSAPDALVGSNPAGPGQVFTLMMGQDSMSVCGASVLSNSSAQEVDGLNGYTHGGFGTSLAMFKKDAVLIGEAYASSTGFTAHGALWSIQFRTVRNASIPFPSTSPTPSVTASPSPSSSMTSSATPSPTPVPAKLTRIGSPILTSKSDPVLSGLHSASKFGASVAFAGDRDGDGIDDLLVGAPLRDFDSPSVTEAGTVFVCYLEATGAVREAVELPFMQGQTGLASAQMGSSVAMLSGWGTNGTGLVLTGGTDKTHGGVALVNVTDWSEAKLEWRLRRSDPSLPGGSVGGGDPLWGQDVSLLSPTWNPVLGGTIAVGAPASGFGEFRILHVLGNGTVVGGERFSSSTPGLESTVDSDMNFGASISSQLVDGVYNIAVGAPKHSDVLVQNGAVAVVEVNASSLEVISAKLFGDGWTQLASMRQHFNKFGWRIRWLDSWGTWGSDRALVVTATGADRDGLYDRGQLMILVLGEDMGLETAFRLDDILLSNGSGLLPYTRAGTGVAVFPNGDLQIGAAGLGGAGGLIRVQFELVTEGTLPSASPATTPTPSVTPSWTPTPSMTSSQTPTPSGTGTPTPSVTPSGTGTPTPSVTPSGTGTPTPSVTPSGTGTPTPSVTPSGTGTPTPSVTPSGTGTPTPSVTPSGTGTPTPSVTPSGTGTPTPSVTPSGTGTPTPSVTPSGTGTPTPSVTSSGTGTPTPSVTPSGTGTPTPSVTPSGTGTPTPSVTPSGTGTPTPSVTPSGTGTPTPSVTPSGTGTPTPSVTPTATATLSPGASPSVSSSPSQSATPSPSASASAPPPMEGPLFDPTFAPVAVAGLATSSSELQPCSDSSADFASSLLPVSPTVASLPVLRLTSPAEVVEIGVRALTPASAPLARSLASLWSVLALMRIGVVGHALQPSAWTADGSASGPLSLSKLNASAALLPAGARQAYAALLGAVPTIPAAPAVAPGAAASMATVAGPLLRASGAALANATGSTLAMALRLSSSSGVAVFARELLLGAASAGSAVEAVGVARNAAGRVGYGSVAFRVGAGASSALRVRASVSGASAGTAQHGDALSISASADASLCGGAKALSLSGSPSWSLRLVGLAPLNSSWPLPAVSVADLDAALQRAWSKRASPARWSVAGGTLPAGHSAEFEVSATAAVASGGAALQTLSGSARAQVSVSATAGLSTLLSSSSGSEIGGTEGSAVAATVRDLDGLEGAASAVLEWECVLVPGADAARLGSMAAAAGGATGSALASVARSQSGAVSCSSDGARSAAAALAAAQDLEAGRVPVPAVDWSRSTLALGGIVTVRAGALRAGALMLSVRAVAGQAGALPPLHRREAVGSVVLQVRSGPALSVQLSAAGSSRGSDGSPSVVHPAHLPLPVRAQVGGSSAGAGRTVLLSWSLRDASAASLVPAFTDDCALAAGQTLWSLLPSGLRVAAGGASVATQAWSPAAPSAFLASLRNVSAAMAGGADASAAATVQSWSLSPAGGSSSASAVDSLVSPAAGSSSGSSRSVTACALRWSALYEVEVRAVRPSDGAEGSAVLRIRTSARPSGGLLAVSATSTDAGPATGPWSSSLAVAVPALAADSVAFEARGLAGAVSVSFVAFKPTVAAAEALAASPSSAQARLDAVMGAQRTVLSSGVSAQSPTVALPAGAGEWGVLVIGAVAQSADGGVSVSLSAASGGALLVQAMSPVAVHAARDLSDEVLVASQLGNASTDDASASVAAAAALIWNSSSAGGGIAASAADALALGDTEGALSRVAGAASLLGAVSASQSQSASKCARELILLGQDGATGPHASCSGRGKCSLSGQAPECEAVLARAIGATANADDRRAAASAGEQELADAGCRASCVCLAGRKGSACGLSEAASAAQAAAMGSLLRTLHGAATQAGDGSSADQLASAASGVRAAVSGDPEGVDGASAGLALDTLETLSTVSAASSREGGGNETTGSIPAELASHVCSALSGLLASGVARASSEGSASLAGGQQPGRRLGAASSAELDEAAARAWDAARTAFRARRLLAPAALQGFVSTGGSYADDTVTISAAEVSSGAGLAEQAGAGVGALAARGGGTLVTTAWSRGTSPFAAAAAAARLQEAADAARAAAVSRADAASNASLGDSQLDSGTVAAMAVSAASSVGQVTEVTMLVPAGGGAQQGLESGFATLLADEGCLARGGANGSLAATYGVAVAAGQSAAAGLVTASPALGVASPHVRCLREPLLLRLPLPAGMTAADFVPRWWSEETGSWATGGVVVLSVDEASRTAVVATTHLTGFAATAEAVLARVRLPSLSRDVGRLRNYLRPENALPALVIGGIVLAFAIAWVVAWRYDQADRTRARYMAARRALVLAYGFTGVPTHEQARSFKRLQRLRRLEEQGIRRKLRRARRQREAGGQVVPGESHGGARSSTISRSARRGSVAAAGGVAAAQVDGAWFSDPRSAPADEPRSPTRESSALSQYSRWVCQLFMMKLRSDHPLSFCTAPPEALVTFTRTQRVLVLCVLWILSMSVAAAFFGKQPASIEVRAGVVLLSALCMLPATFLLPFVFRYVSSLRSVTATVGSRAPAMREWASAVASTDRSAGAAKPGGGRSSVPVRPRGRQREARSSSAPEQFAVRGAEPVRDSHGGGSSRGLADEAGRSGGSEGGRGVGGRKRSWRDPAGAAVPVLEDDEAARASPVLAGLPARVAATDAAVVQAVGGAGGSDDGSDSGSEGSVAFRPAMSIEPPMEPDVTAVEPPRLPSSVRPAEAVSAAVVPSASPGQRRSSAARWSAGPSGGARSSSRSTHSRGSASVGRRASWLSRGALPADMSRRTSGLEAAEFVAEQARREKDFVLLTNLHADVILKFSPYLRGPPGSSATAARIASYFTVWCGLALVGAAAVFAVSAEGYPGKDTGLTPRSVCFLGLGVAAMGALALLLIRRAGVAARSAAKHGHQVFLAAAAKRRTPLERRRRDSQLGADTASRRFQGGRAAGGGAGAAVAEGVVTKSALEASAGKALRSAYRRAGCCGCLGGAWLVGAGIVLGSVYIGQVVAAVLFVMLLDSPLALEACLTIAGLEGALLVSVAGVLVFLWWDARRAHSRALVIAFEGGGVNRLLRAQVEEELRRRHRRQALMDAKAADAAVLSVTRRAMRGPRMVLDAAGVEIIVARLWTSRLVKPAPSGGSVLPPALRRFQAAAATVLVRDVLGRHLEDAGVLEASSRRSSVSAGRASGLGSPSGAESGSFVSGSARPIARLAWRQMEEECAVQIQATWRGHIGRRSALRMYELQVWEEDLALERGCLTGLVYAVAMLLLGAGTFICLVFGVLFTPEQARVWLLTSLASFALDLLVQKPVVIFCNAVALTVWGACTGRTASWANVSPNFVGAGGAWMGVL